MFARGRKVPGGVCRFWGSCGAVEMELPKQVVCIFSKENKQYLGKKCPYHA